MSVKMHAVVFDSFGDTNVLDYREVVPPALRPDEVLVRLHRAAVNHLDLDIRSGVSGMTVARPHVLGTEGVGEVVELGVTVADWQVGRRVGTYAFHTCGLCDNCRAGRINMCTAIRTLGGDRWGTYATHIAVHQSQLVAIPDALGDEPAIASYKYATAWEALVDTVKLQSGETVLVIGAAGGVGSAATQLAVHLGARVIGAAGSAQKAAYVEGLGAAQCIDYSQEDLAEAVLRYTDGVGADVVFDVAGGETLRQAVKATRHGGRIAVVGAHAGEEVTIDFVDLFRRHISIHGCGRYTPAILARVFEMLGAGLPAAAIAGRFPLKDAAQAHIAMARRDFVGRFVLIQP